MPAADPHPFLGAPLATPQPPVARAGAGQPAAAIDPRTQEVLERLEAAARSWRGRHAPFVAAGAAPAELVLLSARRAKPEG